MARSISRDSLDGKGEVMVAGFDRACESCHFQDQKEHKIRMAM